MEAALLALSRNKKAGRGAQRGFEAVRGGQEHGAVFACRACAGEANREGREVSRKGSCREQEKLARRNSVRAMAGRGFTVNKDWDNPVEHAMPEEARVPAEVRLGAVVVRPATVLAPMAGVTDTVFRRFIRHASLFTREQRLEIRDRATAAAGVESTVTNVESGCGLIMTEFTSADGLARMRETKRKRYLTYYDDEHPISAQLFGSNPETLAESARIVQDAGFDLVDLNLGCPAKRVVACNGGSGLLRDLPQIETIFKTIRAAVTIPFTVKFRLGWDDRNLVHVALAR